MRASLRPSGPVGCTSGLGLASFPGVVVGGWEVTTGGRAGAQQGDQAQKLLPSLRFGVGWAGLSSAAGEVGLGSPEGSTPGRYSALCPVALATHLSLLSSIRSSASEKFSTWSPLGSGCTEQRTEGVSADVPGQL